MGAEKEEVKAMGEPGWDEEGREVGQGLVVSRWERVEWLKRAGQGIGGGVSCLIRQDRGVTKDREA